MRCPVCKKEHPGEELSPGALSAAHAACVRKTLTLGPSSAARKRAGTPKVTKTAKNEGEK